MTGIKSQNTNRAHKGSGQRVKACCRDAHEGQHEPSQHGDSMQHGSYLTAVGVDSKRAHTQIANSDHLWHEMRGRRQGQQAGDTETARQE